MCWGTHSSLARELRQQVPLVTNAIWGTGFILLGAWVGVMPHPDACPVVAPTHLLLHARVCMTCTCTRIITSSTAVVTLLLQLSKLSPSHFQNKIDWLSPTSKSVLSVFHSTCSLDPVIHTCMDRCPPPFAAYPGARGARDQLVSPGAAERLHHGERAAR